MKMFTHELTERSGSRIKVKKIKVARIVQKRENVLDCSELFRQMKEEQILAHKYGINLWSYMYEAQDTGSVIPIAQQEKNNGNIFR